MLAYIHHRIARFGQNLTQRLEQRFIAATKPAASPVMGSSIHSSASNEMSIVGMPCSFMLF
jgi:hypothetical protein